MAASIEVVVDEIGKPRYVATELSRPVKFVRFGLWDCAMRTFEDGPSMLWNEQNEADNFIGADSRRFYIRVSDPEAAGSSVVFADWVTTWIDGKDHDRNQPRGRDGGDPRITLFERSKGVFTSNALMLAVGDVDAGVLDNVVPDRELRRLSALQTHAGFSLPPPYDFNPLRSRGQSDFRIRQASMYGFVKVTYPADGKDSVRVPVFQRGDQYGQDERRVVQVCILCVRDHTTRAPAISDIKHPNCPLWANHVQRAREVYERVGILIKTVALEPLSQGCLLYTSDAADE